MKTQFMIFNCRL